MIYYQGDTFYPEPFIESGSWVAAADWAFIRLSDGFFLDFNDSTFKSTAWTTKHKTLTDASPLWIDTTGITLPSANSSYMVLYREDSGDYLKGEKVIVKLSSTPTAVQIRQEIDSNSTQLAAIVADTNELQTDDIPTTLATIAGYLDTEIAAILVDTGTSIPALIAALNNLSSADVTAAVPTAIQNADTLLDRDMAVGADTSSPTKRTVRSALRTSRNKVALVGGTWTVYKENDITPSHTYAEGRTASLDTLTSLDPPDA